jgi:hypothetical protein
VVLEKNSSGEYLDSKECFKCADNTYPGPPLPVYNCKACPDGQTYDKTSTPWKCSCVLSNQVAAGDECLPLSDSQIITNLYPVIVAKSLTFNNIETADSNVDSALTIANSDTIEFLYLKSAYHCISNLEAKSCQVLANLCVLQLYDQNNPICKLYQYIYNSRSSVTDSSE